METTSQVEQLKLNVSNINSFLISKNKEQKKLKSDKKRLEFRRADTLKREKEERKLEKKQKILTCWKSIGKSKRICKFWW